MSPHRSPMQHELLLVKHVLPKVESVLDEDNVLSAREPGVRAEKLVGEEQEDRAGHTRWLQMAFLR
jgi:hypothetical protein